MKIGIMQPYIFPYIGYFQLINAVDRFVVYDNIQFTKKGWINRNRILVNGKDEYITLPLKKDSDYCNIVERKLAGTFKDDRIKLLRKINEAYKKSPHFKEVFPWVESVINKDAENLFDYILYSLKAVCKYLDIQTEFITSSEIQIDHQLRAQDKVIAICKALNATQYVNPIGGVELYAKDVFRQHNIELNFIKSKPVEYAQFGKDFLPWLSIIDVMMFNSKETIAGYLSSYEMV